MTDSDGSSLQTKLDEWLTTEGYPLEYFTAATFRSHGFDVHQGSYVRSAGDEKPRELDVVADMQIKIGKSFLRISLLAECKSSKDKPWVVFTSSRGRMAPSACIAQTVGSSLCDALLWMISSDQSIHGLDVFATPAEPGFGGRQAFAKGNDLFYSSMSGITSACVAEVEEVDRANEDVRRRLPRYGLICFPVVVIDGRLFEARFDEKAGQMVTKEVQNMRCHWRGAAAWPLHATVDIVTRDGLASFAQRRADDVQTLLTSLREAHERLELAFRENSRELLGLKKGPTGRGKLPEILAKIGRR